MKNLRRVLPLLAVSALFFAGPRALALSPVGAPCRAIPVSQPARPSQAALHWQNASWVFDSEQAGRNHWQAADEDRAQQQITALAPARFDRDGNGRFDETEFNAWLGAVRSAIVASPGAMERFDRNQDGKLDHDEWKAVVEHLVGKA